MSFPPPSVPAEPPDAPKIKPGKVWYWIGGLLVAVGVIGGLVLALAGFLNLKNAIEDFGRFRITDGAGQATVIFEKPDTYSIYYESKSRVCEDLAESGGACTTADVSGESDPPAQLDVSISNESGALDVQDSDSSFTYSFGDFSGTEVNTVRGRRAGLLRDDRGNPPRRRLRHRARPGRGLSDLALDRRGTGPRGYRSAARPAGHHRDRREAGSAQAGGGDGGLDPVPRRNGVHRPAGARRSRGSGGHGHGPLCLRASRGRVERAAGAASTRRPRVGRAGAGPTRCARPSATRPRGGPADEPGGRRTGPGRTHPAPAAVDRSRCATARRAAPRAASAGTFTLLGRRACRRQRRVRRTATRPAGHGRARSASPGRGCRSSSAPERHRRAAAPERGWACRLPRAGLEYHHLLRPQVSPQRRLRHRPNGHRSPLRPTKKPRHRPRRPSGALPPPPPPSA